MKQENGTRVVSADYNDVSGLATVLETNKVEVVISTINSLGDITPELNVIHAAEKSAPTKRYIPSIWAIRYTSQ